MSVLYHKCQKHTFLSGNYSPNKYDKKLLNVPLNKFSLIEQWTLTIQCHLYLYKEQEEEDEFPRKNDWFLKNAWERWAARRNEENL